MEKTYRYTKALQYRINLKIPIIFLCLMFLLNLFRYWAICSHSPAAEIFRKTLSLPSQESPFKTVLCAIAYLLLAILVYRVHRNFSTKSIRISDRGIIYKDYKKVLEITFEEITRITTRWVIRISSNKGNIILTGVLDDYEDFLMELKSALDQRGLSDRYDKNKLLLIIQQAMVEKQMKEIFSETKILPLVPAMICFLCVATLFGFIAGIEMKFIGLWLLVSLVYFILAFFNFFFIISRICVRRMKKETDSDSFIFPPRNREREKQLGLKTIFWSGIIYVVLTMGFYLSAPFWISMAQ